MKACTAAILFLAMAGPAAARCAPPAPDQARVRGVVREAASGAVLCIQAGPDHLDLTRVRLSDVPAPPLIAPGGEGAKWALRRAARGKAVTCDMDARDPGAGVCRIAGRSVAERLAAR